MMTNEPDSWALRLDTRLVTAGAVLAGVGGFLGFAGVALGGVALGKLARQWVSQLDQPPNAIAKLRWQQLMAAAAAGAEGWRNGVPTQPTDGDRLPTA